MPILTHTRQFRLLLFAALAGLNVLSANAQTLTAPEYKIKAAFLYNFAKLTEWPTNAFKSKQSPITIGVIGKDPFGRFLDEAVKDKLIDNRKITVERFRKLENNITECHLLFIAESEADRLAAIFSFVKDHPVLTVGEINQFNYKGGMIWLKKEKDEIKFRIKRAAVHDAGLKLSSKLLALGINTRPGAKETK